MAIPGVTSERSITPRHPRRRALRAARLIHPFPTFLNLAASAALAFVAVHGAPDPSLLVRMLLVMLLAQSAIGVTNDYFDQELDAAAKPWKPIPAGLVSPGAALAIAAALIIGALALATTLGPAGFSLAALGMACGLAYDVKLKRTAFSAVPYMIAIPTLPLWVWVTLGEWQRALWWLLPLGALIGLSLHLANTLSDIDEDAAHGVAGLAHRLGARRSMYLGWLSFALALTLSVAISPLVGYDWRIFTPTLLFGCIGLSAAVAVHAWRRDAISMQFGFGALAVSAAVLASGWLAAVTS